jgi:oligopeptide/dipeptide ABC transporter ATP-binding protein
MADSTNTVLSARGLSVQYANESPTLSGINMDIAAGEIVGLTGSSGSGKSTLAYALLGLTRRGAQITSGKINFDSNDLLALSDVELEDIRGRDIALIVQNPRSALHPMYQVGHQISRVYQAHSGSGRAEAQQRAIEMLRLVGINDPERRANAFVHELSGGMAQRVLIALALSTNPKLLIADEPTSGLDVTVQAQFLDTMWETSRKTGTAMVLVTQEPGILANYCDRVIELYAGRVAKDVSASEFVSTSTLHSAQAPSSGQGDGQNRVPLLKVEGLRKTFPLRGTKKVVQAVDDVSLSLFAGESIGLVGESGSGKSTVGRCLLKLLDSDAGKITFDGQDLGVVSGEALRRIRQRIQIVQQDPYDSFDPRWSIEKSLLDPLEIHQIVPPTEARVAIEDGLKRVSVDTSVLKRRPKDLSAGVLQRVSIARSLLMKPDFLVLDEPTSMLAPQDRHIILDVLKRLRTELGLSYLLISHDLTSVASACDRVVVMYLGQVVEQGPTGEIFEKPIHPYTKALIGAHLEEKPETRRVDRKDRVDLEGEIPSPIDLPVGCYLATRCPQATEACHQERQILSPFSSDHDVRCMRVGQPEFDEAS